MFCLNCGKEIPAESKFCPGCGKTVDPVPNASNTASGSAEQVNPNDAEQNKPMAILAYILFFVPLFAGAHKTSDFVKYHTNQGTVLAIFSVALSIATSILSAIFKAIFNVILLPELWWFGIRPLLSLLWLAPLALCIIGIINAAKNQMKPLPVIGKFTIIK